jgi:hypothetical protein
LTELAVRATRVSWEGLWRDLRVLPESSGTGVTRGLLK